MDFEKAGKPTGKIRVHMHHKILELFSANLYSSPNKAFEELVCNSYDARANKVGIYVPDNFNSDSFMWVCDNGVGMDKDGLRLLWQIGETKKREGSEEDKERLPIGKFGIGKLATYVLARKLTHISKSDGKILAVTMDYTKFKEGDEKGTELELERREISEDEAIKVLKPIVEPKGRNMLKFKLWGKDAEESWTIAIMSDFRSKAQQITEGRLKWVLSTALPLSPGFILYYNGKKLESSKLELKPIKEWTIGEDDKVVEKNEDYDASTYKDEPCVNLPHLHNVRGKIELYEDSLLRGKSKELGRSHGIFLMIRGRLVNLDEPLIGTLEALHHGTMNRMRFIIHADDLDEYLTSGRETISTSEALSDLQEYINTKFSEVKTFMMNYFKEEELQRDASYKLSKPSMSLSRRPLLVLARKFFAGEIEQTMFTKIPEDLSKDAKEEFLDKLETDLLSEEGMIKKVELGDLGSHNPIAQLDLEEGKVVLNLMHPFIANFSTEVNSSMLPFKLIATNEILTEAFMIEIGIEQSKINQVMQRRDQLLREVIYSDNPSTPQVALMLRDSIANSKSRSPA